MGQKIVIEMTGIGRQLWLLNLKNSDSVNFVHVSLDISINLFHKMSLLFLYLAFMEYQMSELKIGSLNCRGLFSDQIKRRDIFSRCREKYDISILVDVHSTKEVEHIWQSEWGLKQYLARGPARVGA